MENDLEIQGYRLQVLYSTYLEARSTGTLLIEVHVQIPVLLATTGTRHRTCTCTSFYLLLVRTGGTITKYLYVEQVQVVVLVHLLVL
jgi:hypothetical protein